MRTAIFSAVLDLMKAKFCGQPYDQNLYDETIAKADGTDGLTISDLPDLEVDARRGRVRFQRIPAMVRVRKIVPGASLASDPLHL